MDFQSFSLVDETKSLLSIIRSCPPSLFGPRRSSSPDLYLYQSIPGVVSGKRDTLYRFSVLDELFDKADLNLDKRTILDVGTNIGLNLYYSLSKSAALSIGLDLPDVIASTSLILPSLGASRYSLHGLDLTNTFALQSCLSTLPEYDVLFYFSISGHIGFNHSFVHSSTKLKYLVYESHANISVNESLELLSKHAFPSKLLSSLSIADGDSGRRSLLITTCMYHNEESFRFLSLFFSDIFRSSIALR